eukprot:CAMPEP_0197656168 /NCGR_PEP_ID=MMETSP1338-20131121/40611_1 /TAXON_ID=43686 ORGANISM="Pelagodinium beii, Strain RCC1491" /NCGR_SAMPLE_ID=MMETSP1338 /ASSEMBLY_ACC=CAM_ASM_000754 /LENGTH=70 /DNA_ID=CAMNT_0043232031 /DNA_START=618 /DNA_END=830 /DNA_ORIENTATION=-
MRISMACYELVNVRVSKAQLVEGVRKISEFWQTSNRFHQGSGVGRDMMLAAIDVQLHEGEIRHVLSLGQI